MAKAKPVWDLYRDGVTQGFLAKFTVCPERARLSYVEGLTEAGLRGGLEFGSAFHHCLETPDIAPSIKTNEYQCRKLQRRSVPPRQMEEFERLMGLVEVTAESYLKYWNEDRTNIEWVSQEQTFRVPYRVPLTAHHSTREIPLRGRWDGVFRKRDDNNRLWLFETKTKSDIDIDGLQTTLAQDLQTMFYVTAVEHVYKERVAGVLYNVIRRPGLRISEAKRETLPSYLQRVRQDIAKRPGYYFHRWEVQLSNGDIGAWQERSLNPLLRKACLWWDDIKGDPHNPWHSPHHYQRPFGIYDGMAQGRRGDFHELLTTGSTHGLVLRSEPFPELEEGSE